MIFSLSLHIVINVRSGQRLASGQLNTRKPYCLALSMQHIKNIKRIPKFKKIFFTIWLLFENLDKSFVLKLPKGQEWYG